MCSQSEICHFTEHFLIHVSIFVTNFVAETPQIPHCGKNDSQTAFFMQEQLTWATLRATDAQAQETARIGYWHAQIFFIYSSFTSKVVLTLHPSSPGRRSVWMRCETSDVNQITGIWSIFKRVLSHSIFEWIITNGNPTHADLFHVMIPWMEPNIYKWHTNLQRGP